MERKQMTLAQAEARLLKGGCTFKESGLPGVPGNRYRMILIPCDVHMGLKMWAAVDCIRRHMPFTYTFETVKRAKRTQE